MFSSISAAMAARTPFGRLLRGAFIAAVEGGIAAVNLTGFAMDRMIAAHERWRQRQALMKLDDHLLKDIGLSRADVEKEVSKPIWRA